MIFLGENSVVEHLSCVSPTWFMISLVLGCLLSYISTHVSTVFTRCQMMRDEIVVTLRYSPRDNNKGGSCAWQQTELKDSDE